MRTDSLRVVTENVNLNAIPNLHVRGRFVRDRDRLGGMQVILVDRPRASGPAWWPGFALSEWVGGVSRLRVTGAARRLREPAPTRLTTSASARAVLAALQAEPRLAGIPVDALPVARGVVELRGWVPSARRAPWPGGRRWPRPASRASSTACWCAARTTCSAPGTRAPPTRAHDRAARPPIQSVRHRVRPLRLVAGARAVRAQPGTGRALRDHDAAAERHGGAAHGSRPQQHRAGRADPLRADARPAGAVAAGHRPRRHRHAERGRAAARQGGAHPVRPRPRGVRRAGRGVTCDETGGAILEQLKAIGASADWRRTDFTLSPELSRAVREAFVTLYEAGLIYRGHYIINWCPRCLTALSNEEAEKEETDGQALAHPLPARRRRAAHRHRRHDAPRDDARRHRRGRAPRGRALPRTDRDASSRLPVVDRLVPIVADDAVTRRSAPAR